MCGAAPTHLFVAPALEDVALAADTADGVHICVLQLKHLTLTLLDAPGVGLQVDPPLIPLHLGASGGDGGGSGGRQG